MTIEEHIKNLKSIISYLQDRIEYAKGDDLYVIQGKMDIETFKVALQALEQIQQIKDIINAPVYIQEDVMRYKAICEVIKGKEE